MTNTTIKHLITWSDWGDEEIKKIFNLAIKLKKDPANYYNRLQAKTMIMLFQKTSSRTRVSFEVGMNELGGYALFLDWNTTNFQLTKIGYEAAYLSTNSHIMMARMKKHSDLQELKKWSSIPLINGCCDTYHPCQAMSDMLTIYLDRGEIKGAKLTYLGVHNNVANSLMAMCAVFGIELTLVCPLVPEGAVDHKIKERIQGRNLLVETLDKEAAVREADYVYTDTWLDMEFFSDPKYQKMKEERVRLMLPYQINAELMKGSNAKIMHDMPIHAGYEISEEMVASPNSIIFTQSSNRLPTQKAIILTLLNEA